MGRAAPWLVALGIAVACPPALLGCGAQPASPDAGHAAVRVKLKDFRIVAPVTVPAGDVRLVIANQGPDDHELAVVRSPVVGTLPMRPDGVTIDEEAIEHATAAGMEPEPAGSVSELRMRLKPGRYTLLCNMSGHYLGGMSTTVVAR